MELGHSCLGITDHSYGLPDRARDVDGAGRQAMDRDRRAQREVRGRFRVFKGIEANILVDGSLDLQPDELARLRIRRGVAAFDRCARKDDQTPRMLNAMRHPGVAILGHPRGRMFNTRPGVAADWDAVFEEAARLGVAIELDGNWHRQDIDYRSRAARSPRAAFSRSTATRTPSGNCASATTRSRTRAWLASRRSA